jgi:hypothetical protein
MGCAGGVSAVAYEPTSGHLRVVGNVWVCGTSFRVYALPITVCNYFCTRAFFQEGGAPEARLTAVVSVDRIATSPRET